MDPSVVRALKTTPALSLYSPAPPIAATPLETVVWEEGLWPGCEIVLGGNLTCALNGPEQSCTLSDPYDPPLAQ